MCRCGRAGRIELRRVRDLGSGGSDGYVSQGQMGEDL